MHARALPLLTLGLLAASNVPAQVTPHEKTLPKAFAGSFTTGSNIFLGRSRILFQQWYRGDNLRPGLITTLGLRDSALSAGLQHKLELVLANTSSGFAMSKTFTSNLGASPLVFFAMKTVVLPPIVQVPVDPNASSTWFQGDRPFVFTGPHFVVQFDVQTAATYGTLGARTVDGLYQTSAAPVHGTGGGGSCGNGRLSSSYATSNLTLQLTPIPPSRPAFLLLGFDPLWFGGLRLPLDLTPLGFAGCTLKVDPLLVLPMTVSATGTGRIDLPIPIPAGDTYAIHCQGLFADTAKPSGYATSNATWSLIGNAGQSNYMYNWSRDGTDAEYGPYPVNSNVVVFVRP